MCDLGFFRAWIEYILYQIHIQKHFHMQRSILCSECTLVIILHERDIVLQIPMRILFLYNKQFWKKFENLFSIFSWQIHLNFFKSPNWPFHLTRI